MNPEALALEMELLQRELLIRAEESSFVPPEEVSFVCPVGLTFGVPEALAVPLAEDVLSVVLFCDIATAAKRRRRGRCTDVKVRTADTTQI